MANVKITELTAYTNPASTDVLPIVDVGEDTTKKVTIADLLENAGDGAAATPAFSFDNDKNTGIYRPGADQVAVSTAGTARLTVSTSAVTSALPVDVLLGSASTPSFTFTGDLNTGIYSPGADQVAISTSGTGRLFIDSSGNIGINGAATAASSTKTLQITDSVTARVLLESTGAGGRKYGWYTSVDGQFAVYDYTTSSERLRIDSSGNVGIGTSSPSGNLHVYNPATTSADIYLENTDGYFDFKLNNQNFDVFEGANSRVRIATGGNVGIGTTTPQGNLSFGASVSTINLDTSDGSDNKRLALNGGGGGINSGRGGYIALSGNEATNPGNVQISMGNTSGTSIVFNKGDGSEVGRWDSSGRLLVGTSSAVGTSTVKLQGNSSNSNNQSIFLLARGSNPGANNNIGELRFTDDGENVGAVVSAVADGSAWAASDYPTRLVFSTTADGSSTPTERMRIQSSGRILLGTSSTTYASASWKTTSRVGVVTTSSSNSGDVAIECAAGSTSLRHHISFSNTNGVVGSISTSASATAYNTSSDHRLKENVVDIADGITRVKQLAPKRFNFIADAETTVDGFLAHEAQTVVPEAVTGTHNEVDDDGNPVYQGIDQSKLVPLLTAALQEAIGEIESLKARVSVLEAN